MKKIMIKVFVVSVIFLFLSPNISFSMCSLTPIPIPGVFAGIDPGTGGIICLPPWNETCFVIWVPTPKPGGEVGGDLSNGRCFFIESASWGLVDINGLTKNEQQSQTIYIPNRKPTTREVNCLEQVESWIQNECQE
jgi:hypothetical protein